MNEREKQSVIPYNQKKSLRNVKPIKHFNKNQLANSNYPE